MNPEQLENARKSINHMLNAYRQLVNLETSYPKESEQNEMMEELNLKVSSLIEETRATVGSLRLMGGERIKVQLPEALLDD